MDTSNIIKFWRSSEDFEIEIDYYNIYLELPPDEPKNGETRRGWKIKGI